jgi:hypothetical protein
MYQVTNVCIVGRLRFSRRRGAYIDMELCHTACKHGQEWKVDPTSRCSCRLKTYNVTRGMLGLPRMKQLRPVRQPRIGCLPEAR